MVVVALNRRFVEWGDDAAPEPDLRYAMGLAVGWEELLAKRRVEILAEAGSGKSTEMAERARLMAAAGRTAFHATVEDVGREGLEGALDSGDRAKVTAWRASREEAWFFIDSVDEGKTRGVRLEKVVRRLADGIEGAEARAHIIISGRISDWEFRKDLESVASRLPIPGGNLGHGTTPEEELLRIVRQLGRPKGPPSPEKPLVVIMARLDRDRVRLFAKAKGANDLDQFLAQVEAANLWHFARRPLDLDWLVRFWQNEKRLGSLAEMVERSVTERLKETNLDRGRSDRLDIARALQAAERIGAALVFGRRTTIAIPDSEITFPSDSALDLADVLPDWSADDRALLLTRPLFDPATLGRARLHNDNEGVVRGYLTARWLTRLREANLPWGTLFDLLFARSCGLEVVKPSLNETAAWLSLWDRDVASEVVRRNPQLLLSYGDPATLAPDVRRDALARLIGELASADHELPWPDSDNLRRFAQPDLDGVVQKLWNDYRSHPEVAMLLLRLVECGALKGCAGLAEEATFDANADPAMRVLAGRALLVTGNEQSKRRYAALVVAERSTLPIKMVRGAIGALFPDFLSINDLLTILEAIDVADDHGGLGFASEGPLLVNKLNSRSDLEQLLKGLLTQIRDEIREYAGYPPNKREAAYFPAIAATAARLLKACAPEDAPEPAIDAVLRVGNRRNIASELETALGEARAELHRTTSRRRCAFWRVAARLRGPSEDRLRVYPLRRMERLGYPAGLRVEDIDWLLSDGLQRDVGERQLATHAALEIQQAAGSDAFLERIALIVRTDAVACGVYDSWMQPRPAVPGPDEYERQNEEIERQYAADRAKSEQHWIDLIRELRSDAARVARLRSPTASGVNPDLYALWRLLSGADGRSKYAIDSISPLEVIVGSEVAEAARDGLIALWRNTAPALRSQKDLKGQNSITEIEAMGIAGVTLEAATRDRWAEKLTSAEATLVTGYATLELNGFPRWLQELAVFKPQEVRAVLFTEALAELANPDTERCHTLGCISHSNDGIAHLVAPVLLDDLERRTNPPEAALSHLLRIIVRGAQPDDQSRFIKLGLARFDNEMDLGVAALYLAAVFSLDPVAATNALTARLGTLGSGGRAVLADQFLSLTFDNYGSSTKFNPSAVTAETLEQLVRIAFRRSGEDPVHQRPAETIYKLNGHDFAERARSAVFNRLAGTEGTATFYALLRLQDDPACPIPPARLRTIAAERAVKESESAPWPPAEAFDFEQSHETAPRTPRDLQILAIRRIDDMQRDLLHGDFAQGATLEGLPHEVEVQNWIADRLRLKQGRSYSVEREPHVVDEKEPDVRFRAKATDASVAMEIKVAESWSLKEPESALEDQLCGRYLRASDGRWGILLLVHQKPKRWQDTQTGLHLTFTDVVTHLRILAARIAGANHDFPQPEVCVLDVSAC